MGKSKSSRSKQVQKSFFNDNKHNKFHDTSKNRQHEKIENKEKFAVSQTKRIDLRRKILKDFHTFCIRVEYRGDRTYVKHTSVKITPFLLFIG